LRPIRKPRRARGITLMEFMVTVAVLSVVLGFVGALVLRVQRSYLDQREVIEAQNNARTALDTLVRLIRTSGNDPQRIGFQAMDPDPDLNRQLDSVRLRGDWNPADGALDDPYEDIAFTVAHGVLLKQEPGDPGPSPFLEAIESLGFLYYDRNNNLLATPTLTPGQIASVDVIVQIRPPGMPVQAFRSSATIRRREQ